MACNALLCSASPLVSKTSTLSSSSQIGLGPRSVVFRRPTSPKTLSLVVKAQADEDGISKDLSNVPSVRKELNQIDTIPLHKGVVMVDTSLHCVLIIGDAGKKPGDGSGDRKHETIAPSSPLYLHPSDSPSLSLTQIKFDGENYELWADAVKNGLDAKNKLAFVEGTIAKPETAAGEEESLESVAWRQCNAMIKAWLRNVIEVRLHPSISFSGTVPEIWKELKERFSTGNAPRVHQLKGDLADCKQGKDQSIVDYYTKLKSIWDELSTYSRVPQCTCGAAAALLKEREEEKVHQFLMGLDTTLYGNIRSNLLMEDDITSLSRAYALVLREERHKAVTKTKEEINEAAMAVKTNIGGGRGNGSNANQERGDQEPPHLRTAWNTIEDENGIRMWFDVPGVKPQEINVDVVDNLLLIKGKEGIYTKDGLGGFIRSPFDCKLQLPFNSDKLHTNAVLKNVLYISVPKITKAEQIDFIHVPVKSELYE